MNIKDTTHLHTQATAVDNKEEVNHLEQQLKTSIVSHISKQTMSLNESLATRNPMLKAKHATRSNIGITNNADSINKTSE